MLYAGQVCFGNATIQYYLYKRFISDWHTFINLMFWFIPSFRLINLVDMRNLFPHPTLDMNPLVWLHMPSVFIWISSFLSHTWEALWHICFLFSEGSCQKGGEAVKTHTSLPEIWEAFVCADGGMFLTICLCDNHLSQCRSKTWSRTNH